MFSNNTNWAFLILQKIHVSQFKNYTFQRCFAYKVSEKISAPAAIPNHIPVQDVKRLTLSESYKVFMDPQNQTHLFPEGYLCVPGFWMPYRANNRTLRAEACRNDVTALFSPDGTTCESVAFHSLLLIKDGVTRFDVWVYGSQVTARTVLSHFFLLVWSQISCGENTSSDTHALFSTSCGSTGSEEPPGGRSRVTGSGWCVWYWWVRYVY